MNKKSIALLIVLGGFFFSCIQEKKIDNDCVKKINFSDLKHKRFIIPNEKIDFIPLETRGTNLVGDIERLVVKDSLFFVLDKNRNLFVFDFLGKFLNRIGAVGQGPDELHHLSYFYVDDKRKQVGIYDLLRRKVYHYEYSGKLVNKIDVVDCLSEDIKTIYGISRGQILATFSKRLAQYESKFNFKLFSLIDSCKKLASYCSFGFNSNRNESVNWSQVGINSTTIFLSPVFSDSIYTLDTENGAKAKYVFKSELKSADTFEKEKFLNMREATIDLKRGGYSNGLYDLLATDKYLIFDFLNYRINKYYHVFWDLEEDKGYYTDFPILPFEISSGLPIYNTYKKKLVTALQSSQILELQQSSYAIKSNRELDSKIAKLTSEDNPIIILYELE